MGRVSREARLLFILLWTLCDDAGRSRGDARLLKGLLFPYDEVTFDQIEGWLTELEGEGCLTQYTRDGSRYVAIRNWLTHQKIDKPSKSKFPDPPDTVESPREDSRDSREVSSGDQGPRTKDQGRDQGPLHTGRAKRLARPAERTPEFTENFARLRLAYPARTGTQRWPKAEQHVNARLKQGHTWEQMHAGVARYVAYVAAAGLERTEKVQQAATFFGTNLGFMEAWDPPGPAKRPLTRYERLTAGLEDAA